MQGTNKPDPHTPKPTRADTTDETVEGPETTSKPVGSPPERAINDAVIILSDDDADVRKSVLWLLQDNGFTRVYGAATSDETVRLAQELHPDLIITDMLKGKDRRAGEKTARMIKANESLAQVPILLFTGYPLDDAWDLSLFCAFLQKWDFSNVPGPPDLVAAVRRALLEGEKASG